MNGYVTRVLLYLYAPLIKSGKSIKVQTAGGHQYEVSFAIVMLQAPAFNYEKLVIEVEIARESYI